LTAKEAETELRRCLGFANALGINCVGLSGGLALMWTSDVVVDLKSYSKYHIDVWVKESDQGQQWRFTGFYGDPSRSRRKESWRMLRFLRNQFDLPGYVPGISMRY
jgi:hypothetical protein